MVMADHTGHRRRMRERFIRYGLDNFDDHNVLELLLFYAVPRQDTNALAHDLLEAFGTLDGVFDASIDALKSVPGVGDTAAALIHLVPEAARRYFISKAGPGDILADSDAAGKYLLPRFMTCRDETMYLVCMDAKLKVLDCRPIAEGSTTAVSVNLRRVVQIALGQNASCVLLAHNHTGGVALPSREDIAVTLRIRDLLEQVGVTLTDHIVVAGDDFVSMADSGLLAQK